MSGGAPRGSPLRHRSSRRGPRAGGVPGGPRGGPVPPGKLQLLERFFTPPGPPPGAPSSSPSPSSSSSSSGGGEGHHGGPPRSPRRDPLRDPVGFRDPLGTLRDPLGTLRDPLGTLGDPARPSGSRLRRGLSRSHERLHPGDVPEWPGDAVGTPGDIPDPLGDILGSFGDVAVPEPYSTHRRRAPTRSHHPRDIPEGLRDSVGTLGDTPDPLGDILGTFGDIARPSGTRLRRGLSRSHERLHAGDVPKGLGDTLELLGDIAGTFGDTAGAPKGGPHPYIPTRRRGLSHLRLPGDVPEGLGDTLELPGDIAGPLEPLGDIVGTFGDVPMSPKGVPHPYSPPRRSGSSHLQLPGDVSEGLGDTMGTLEPIGDIAGTFGDTPTSPKGAPHPYSPPRRRGSKRGRGPGDVPKGLGDPGGPPGDRGGLRREQSRSQEGLGGLGGGRGGPPRRWRSLEAVGGPRGGPRFSRFLDELTRRVLSPARLHALGWPPRTPGSPRTLEASWVSGSPRAPGSLAPQGALPGGGQGPPEGGMEEEEEEEEEDGGQEPGAAGGAGGPRGPSRPPPPRAELDALRERMDRLQDDYANSQRLNRLLEERLRGLAQAVALERVTLSRRVAEVLQRVLGEPPGTAPPPGTPATVWGEAGAGDDEEGPLPPPPAFRDPPGGALP